MTEEKSEFPGTCGISQGHPKWASEAKEKLSGRGTQVLGAWKSGPLSAKVERGRTWGGALAEPAAHRYLRCQIRLVLVVWNGKDLLLRVRSPVVQLSCSSLHVQRTCPAGNTSKPGLFFSFCSVA